VWAQRRSRRRRAMGLRSRSSMMSSCFNRPKANLCGYTLYISSHLRYARRRQNFAYSLARPFTVTIGSSQSPKHGSPYFPLTSCSKTGKETRTAKWSHRCRKQLRTDSHPKWNVHTRHRRQAGNQNKKKLDPRLQLLLLHLRHIPNSCKFSFYTKILESLPSNRTSQVEIGNINNKAVIRKTYFFTLNLTNIIPSSVGDIVLVNSLARSLGLHDFYQVGLWNFCEGYNDEGITYCSPTQTLYWFNPVEILLNELLAGATIALPAEINNILNLIKLASHLMFGFFLTGVCMNFVNIFLAPIVLYSRWWSLPFAIWTFISALLTAAATIIATVMFVIFRNVITSQQGLNIGAGVGTQMFVFMWIATAFSIFGWLVQLCLACCCASRRDVKTGRKKGRRSAYGDVGSDEKKRPVAGGRRWAKMPRFGRRTSARQAV
jgi:hypothetical protein